MEPQSDALKNNRIVIVSHAKMEALARSHGKPINASAQMDGVAKTAVKVRYSGLEQTSYIC